MEEWVTRGNLEMGSILDTATDHTLKDWAKSLPNTA
jgi:hypothetical protein